MQEIKGAHKLGRLLSSIVLPSKNCQLVKSISPSLPARKQVISRN